MMQAWMLLVPVLLPVAAGIAVALCPPLREKKARNRCTLAVLLLTAAGRLRERMK